MQSDLKQADGNDNAKSDIVAGNTQRHGFRQRVADEFRRFGIMFVYLWLMFGLFVLNERIILGERGIGFTMQGFAVINALVLAKVMLIADYFNAGAWLRRRPMIYRILFDSLFLTVVFICVHVLEKAVAGIFRGQGLAANVPAIGGGGMAGVLCVALILFVSLIPFFGFRSISRELGAAKFNAVLFGTGKASNLQGTETIASEPAHAEG